MGWLVCDSPFISAPSGASGFVGRCRCEHSTSRGRRSGTARRRSPGGIALPPSKRGVDPSARAEELNCDGSSAAVQSSPASTGSHWPNCARIVAISQESQTTRWGNLRSIRRGKPSCCAPASFRSNPSAAARSARGSDASALAHAVAHDASGAPSPGAGRWICAIGTKRQRGASESRASCQAGNHSKTSTPRHTLPPRPFSRPCLILALVPFSSYTETRAPAPEHDSRKLVCEDGTPSLAFHSCRRPDT
jgi:hypothetical protein